MPKHEPLTYRQAGVDIDAGNRLVELIGDDVRRTRRPEVLGGLGGFGALMEVPLDRYREPVMVAGTDGVGTKLKLALALNRHDTIGIDLVAMCVNDIVVQGAEPLLFLDYYATGRLNVDTAASVIRGIAEGCHQAGCALVGGETAELPGMYQGDDYDLAGFCVGLVEKSRIIDGSRVAAGDAILGLASSGFHSNGYSLVRRALEHANADLDMPLGDTTLGEALLAPTRIYVKPLLALLDSVPVHALAHITGGGLPENLPRVMPADTRAVLDAQNWQRPAVMRWLDEQVEIDPAESYRTFNCGIGMAVIVPASHVNEAMDLLHEQGETVFEIGRIESTSGPAQVDIHHD